MTKPRTYQQGVDDGFDEALNFVLNKFKECQGDLDFFKFLIEKRKPARRKK